MPAPEHLRLVKAFVDIELARRLARLAEANDRPIAAEVRRALRTHVDARPNSTLSRMVSQARARIVAAREEIEIGEMGQAAAILADLEVDLCAARDGDDS